MPGRKTMQTPYAPAPNRTGVCNNTLETTDIYVAEAHRVLRGRYKLRFVPRNVVIELECACPESNGGLCENASKILAPWVAEAHRVLQALYLSNCLFLNSNTHLPRVERGPSVTQWAADAHRVLQALYALRSIPSQSYSKPQVGVHFVNLDCTQWGKKKLKLLPYTPTPSRTGSSAYSITWAEWAADARRVLQAL
ncbi:hypothetical protein DFH06DRAFT_1141290 [Mycena polygramma]|nr:hypothetical protein DFH06DRAFT_1141290 [Mycena polygramma]